MRATADVIAFGRDGSARTSSWTFHGTRPNWAQRDDRAEAQPSAASLASRGRGASDQILSLIQQTSARHQQNRALVRTGFTPRDWHILFRAMIEAESNYNPSAKSPKGAYGLGQLMPATARVLGVDPRNIGQNLDGAARYLLAQLAKFGEIDLALAAYNAGPHRVEQYSGIPPFLETRNYIARIHTIRARLSGGHVPALQTHVANNPRARASVVIDLN